jgi:hypothetical protein
VVTPTVATTMITAVINAVTAAVVRRLGLGRGGDEHQAEGGQGGGQQDKEAGSALYWSSHGLVLFRRDRF